MIELRWITARIERSVLSQLPHVERVLLHIESPAEPLLRIAVRPDDQAGTGSAHFGEAAYFALVTVRRVGGAFAERRIVANPHKDVPRAKGIRVAEFLVAQEADVVYSHEDLAGKGPAYALHDAGIELVHGAERTLEAAVAACSRTNGSASFASMPAARRRSTSPA